jgi:CheY-like chemotaxis protein
VKHPQALPAVGRFHHGLAGPLEERPDEGANVLFVVYDENPLPVHSEFIPTLVGAHPPRRDSAAVARVLIVDPDREITDLFAHAVERLGHEAIHWHEGMSVDEADADVILVEPERPKALAFARALRMSRPGTAIVVVSIRSRGGADQELQAVAHLDKPFERVELERALSAALAA